MSNINETCYGSEWTEANGGGGPVDEDINGLGYKTNFFHIYGFCPFQLEYRSESKHRLGISHSYDYKCK